MITVRILTQLGEYVLSKDAVITVPAGTITVVVSGAASDTILFDGREQQCSVVGEEFIFNGDLTRSSGFHRLHIPPRHEYWFATEDAKLRLDGVQQMLAYLRSEPLSWSGQILFSDSSYLRDPHVSYGWLDQHADYLIAVSDDIASHPRRGNIKTIQIQSHSSGKIARKQTLALLRRAAPELLETQQGGPIEVDGVRYTPRRVIDYQTLNTLHTIANHRVIWVLLQLLRLIQEVVSTVDNYALQRCIRWESRCRLILQHTALSTLSNSTLSSSIEVQLHGPTIEELTDTRYAAIYEASRTIISKMGWTAQREQKSLYAFVQYADQIYQAFVAYTVASALGLKQTADALRLTQPAFVNDTWAMYYDITPPKTILRSWRSYSGDPDGFRPDLLFYHHDLSTVVIADAKYRNDGSRASESSRKDVMAYMNAYNAPHAIIFYPPEPSTALAVHRIDGGGRQIFEVAVAPTSELREFLKGTLPEVFATAAFTPTWRS